MFIARTAVSDGTPRRSSFDSPTRSAIHDSTRSHTVRSSRQKGQLGSRTCLTSLNSRSTRCWNSRLVVCPSGVAGEAHPLGHACRRRRLARSTPRRARAASLPVVQARHVPLPSAFVPQARPADHERARSPCAARSAGSPRSTSRNVASKYLFLASSSDLFPTRRVGGVASSATTSTPRCSNSAARVTPSPRQSPPPACRAPPPRRAPPRRAPRARTRAATRSRC